MALLVVGCGTTGLEVRTTLDAADWTPAQVLLLPAAVADKAIPPARGLPGGVSRPTAGDAGALTIEALEAELRERTTLTFLSQAEQPFSRTVTASLVEQLNKQYLNTRAVNPHLAQELGPELACDAILLTAVLRYGPQVEGGLQQMTRSVDAKVGQSDLVIRSAATRVVVYFNAQMRCALVRLSDGAIVWDAAVRKRRKRGLLREATQETVLREAVNTLLSASPYLKLDEN